MKQLMILSTVLSAFLLGACSDDYTKNEVDEAPIEEAVPEQKNEVAPETPDTPETSDVPKKAPTPEVKPDTQTPTQPQPNTTEAPKDHAKPAPVPAPQQHKPTSENQHTSSN